MDVLQGELRDVDLLLLQRYLLLFDDNLRALIACLQVDAALVELCLASGLRRLVLILLDRDALTDLCGLDLVLDLAHADQLVMVQFLAH